MVPGSTSCTAGGKVDAQPLLFRRSKQFARQLLHRVCQLACGVAYVLPHILGAKIGQRIPFAHAAHGNRDVQADKALPASVSRT